MLIVRSYSCCALRHCGLPRLCIGQGVDTPSLFDEGLVPLGRVAVWMSMWYAIESFGRAIHVRACCGSKTEAEGVVL